MFSIVGSNCRPPAARRVRHRHRPRVAPGVRRGASRPAGSCSSSSPRTRARHACSTSLSAIELQRWTHVAVTFDGQVVRFFVNGQPDGTFATAGRIRASQAPLLVGNFFDPRFLTDFGGDLRQGPAADAVPWYALDGGIDELRLSRAARTEFPLHGGR